MIENIRLSVQGIWSHKMRSFLTMLGIIIGIAAIITIVSTIKGTNEQIKENLVGSGNNTVGVLIYQDDYEYEIDDWSGIPEGISVINQTALDEIKDLDNVESVSVYNSRRDWGESVYYNSKLLSSSKLLGIDDNYFQTCGYEISSGRGFIDKDYNEFGKVVIIDDTIRKSLFQSEDPIGKTIEIKGEPFIVVGIAKKSDEFQPTINSIEDYYNYQSDESGVIFMPQNSWPIVYNFDEPQSMIIKASSTEKMSEVGKAAAEILNAYLVTSTTYKYKAENLLEQAKELQDLSSSTNKQLIWIASISLLVGGIGVMNIMLVSVTERTKEIGLKKAIGARKEKILAQFLTEASVLTSLGGILGVLGGIALSQIVSKISQTPVAISVPAILVSVVFSMLIGIIFGLLPSIKAANLNPIDALRYE